MKLAITSTPQLPFKAPQIPFNRDHKASNRGTWGGLGIEAYTTPGNPLPGGPDVFCRGSKCQFVGTWGLDATCYSFIHSFIQAIWLLLPSRFGLSGYLDHRGFEAHEESDVVGCLLGDFGLWGRVAA